MNALSVKFLLGVLLFWTAPAFAREVVDALGTRVQLKDKPARVVTLAPSLGELAADLTPEEMQRIVGVSEYTDYPPMLKKVRSIGPYSKFNLETVVALKPDLVLATSDGNPRDQVLHLRELGLPVVVVSTENFQQIEESIQLVGKAMGAEEAADAMARRFKRGLANFRERANERARAAGFHKKKVLVQIGGDPLVVAGGKSFLQQAVDLIGADNLYADSSAKYPRPSMEEILKRNPEQILVMALGPEVDHYRRMALAWKAFPGLQAVKNQQVQVLHADPLLRPTLRLLEGLSLLEKAVYGTH